jgi:hypothetical protein
MSLRTVAVHAPRNALWNAALRVTCARGRGGRGVLRVHDVRVLHARVHDGHDVARRA